MQASICIVLLIEVVRSFVHSFIHSFIHVSIFQIIHFIQSGEKRKKNKRTFPHNTMRAHRQIIVQLMIFFYFCHAAHWTNGLLSVAHTAILIYSSLNIPQYEPEYSTRIKHGKSTICRYFLLFFS